MDQLFPMPPPTEEPKPDALIAEYVGLRDGKKAADKAYEEWLDQHYNRRLRQIEIALLEQLNKQGAESIKTPAGTAFKSTETSITVADGGQFQRFVIGSNLWELVDFRANKTAVKEFLESQKALPPGLNHSETYVVRVRRAS